MSWFVLGTLFGVAFTHMLTSSVSSASTPQIDEKHSALNQQMPTMVVAEDQFASPKVLSVLDSQITTSDEDADDVKEQAAVEAEQYLQTYPTTIDLHIRRGDTLISMLTAHGVAYDEASNMVSNLKKVYNPRALAQDQNITLTLDKTNGKGSKPFITAFTIAASPVKSIEITRTIRGTFKVAEVNAPLTKDLARSGGIITSSLYQTGVEAGIPANMLGELINAYSYDVDFQRDIKNGDRMEVVYERMRTKDGVTAGFGNVIYASLDLGDRNLKLYRYVDKAGTVSYYNELGENIRKALLKTPINGARITSGFGMRMHPLLGYSKMHKGVDFGAAMGTPIYAAGDGVVSYAGRKSSYGNYVSIKHNSDYSTAYAHCSRLASGIRPGQHVKQGQVIAYVGMTGRSTGPHLHYEVIKDGDQVNPTNVKFAGGNKLEGKELLAFKENMNKLNTVIASLPRTNTQVAQIDTPGSDKRKKN